MIHPNQDRLLVCSSPVSDGPLTPTPSGVGIAVWVVPGSSRSVIDGLHGDRLKVRVSAPPEGGKANDEAMKLLTDALGSKVTLISGMRGRAKVFEVSKTDIDTVSRKLGL